MESEIRSYGQRNAEIISIIGAERMIMTGDHIVTIIFHIDLNCTNIYLGEKRINYYPDFFAPGAVCTNTY